jgi:hypothetical protein
MMLNDFVAQSGFSQTEASDAEIAQKKVFYEACITQSILFILYMATIARQIKGVRLNFVIGISALLASTCVTWILECRSQYLYLRETHGLN